MSEILFPVSLLNQLVQDDDGEWLLPVTSLPEVIEVIRDHLPGPGQDVSEEIQELKDLLDLECSSLREELEELKEAGVLLHQRLKELETPSDPKPTDGGKTPKKKEEVKETSKGAITFVPGAQAMVEALSTVVKR